MAGRIRLQIKKRDRLVSSHDSVRQIVMTVSDKLTDKCHKCCHLRFKNN